ncbi:MAG: FtsX-like permease family protein [Eubacteriales bacterium]|nr:FtsX-like permease family protein [Eubacteriales bacterium]
MKKKNPFIRILINRSFRANKARNLVAILAIVLTTLMFTSLFVLSQSMVKNLREMNFRQAGYDSHLTFRSLTNEEMDKIIAHEAVEDWGRSIVIGVAENEELTGRQVEIRYADENYAASAFAVPTTGRMPDGENEIALDTITLEKMGLPCELGQKVTLLWRKDLNGTDYTARTFTLCGYWEGNSAAMASMAWVSRTFMEKECSGVNQADQRDNGQFFGMGMLHVNVGGGNHLEQAAEQILADTGLSDISYGINMAYDSTMNQNIIKEVIPMFICMGLVFASGYLIIYNIFQISVAADIRFYGKLKTLGTSGKQLKKVIYGQANRLSLIGIPVGMILGYALGVVLVPMIIAGNDTKASAAVSLYGFVGSALFAYLTVLISCMRPAKIAGKVSPMEVLRYTGAGADGRKTIRKGARRASIPGMAFANLGRNGKRTFTVIGSLTLGLVLLTGVYAKNASFDMDKYMNNWTISDFEVRDSSIATNFSTYNPYGATISEELVNRIESLEGLEGVGHLYSQIVSHQIGASALVNIQTYYNADDRLAYMEAADAGLARAYHDMIDSGECIAVLYGVDGLALDALSEEYRLLDGRFDEEKFQTGNYILAEAAAGAEESEKETQPTYSVGDRVNLNGQQYEVMGIVANITTITEGVNGGEEAFLSFYLPADTFRQMYPDHTMRKIFFDVADEFQPQAEQMLIDYRNDTDKSLTFTSRFTLKEHYREQTRANTIMGIAISVIIAFVGVLNFINSMVTAIVSRQKEFAMIQSVGMTKRQLRNMLVNEGLFYAAGALIASYISGTLVVAVGVRAMVSGDYTATFRFTLMPLVICTPVLIIFAILIPYICFKNLERQSIVERLRTMD